MNDLEQLKEYIEKVLGYIVGDIDHLIQSKVTVSFPYLFLCFAGIDFLGGIEQGFERGISRKRSALFISIWMSKINPRYKTSAIDDTKGQASYLYNFARSGLIHMACVQRSVIVETDPSWEQYHLSFSTDGGSKVFVHPLLFADEFKKAKQLFLDDLYNDPVKVKNALIKLNAYFTESIEEEKKFVIANLFERHSTNNMLDAKTEPSGSLKSSSTMGTQSMH
jgi:hypothetical protein